MATAKDNTEYDVAFDLNALRENLDAHVIDLKILRQSLIRQFPEVSKDLQTENIKKIMKEVLAGSCKIWTPAETSEENVQHDEVRTLANKVCQKIDYSIDNLYKIRSEMSSTLMKLQEFLDTIKKGAKDCLKKLEEED